LVLEREKMKNQNPIRGGGRPACLQTDKTTSIPIEYDGHLIESNICYCKIGLSSAETAALKKVRRRLFVRPNKVTLAETMRTLVLTAMAHFDTVCPLVLNDGWYARNEGFLGIERYQDNIIQRTFALKQVKGGRWV
jgi:hypothetical protein